MSKTVDYGKLRSVYSWNSNGVKERDARALRGAAVKERNAKADRPTKSTSTGEECLKERTAKRTCAGPGGTGSDKQWAHRHGQGSFPLASFPRCMGASDSFRASR
jgi:hypothetical protein